MSIKRILALMFAFVLVAAACGDDSSSTSDGGGGEPAAPADDGSTDDGSTDDGSTDDGGSDDSGSDDGASDDGGSDEPSSDAPAGGASTLIFDGEEIALNARGCYAETQEVAGSIMTLTAQASGTNAAGEDVLVDFTRFAPGGTVSEADDILIDIGPVTSSITYQANLPFDSVPVVDGVLTVAETTFSSFDDGSEVTASVAIVC